MHRFALRALRRPRYRIPGFVIDWRAGLSFPAGAFTRNTVAYQLAADGIFRPVAAGVPRIGWRPTPALRIEIGATNLVRESNNFGSAWGSGTGLVQSPSASIIHGKAATRHDNDGTGGSRNRAQAVGMFSGGKETAYIIVENVDATATQVSLRDTTQSAFVHRATLNWSTGEATRLDGYDAGATHGAIRIADSGPNGGPVYLLWITTTGVEGNGRSLYIYPTGTTNAQTAAILHHAQLVEGAVVTSPIVTGAGAETRSVDHLYFDLPAEIATPGAQDMAIYARYILGADGVALGNYAGAWGIANAAGVLPRLHQHLSPSNGRVTLDHFNGTSSRSTNVQVHPEPEDLVETLVVFRRDGSGRLIAAVNSGHLSGADLATLSPAPAWSAPRLYIGSRGSAAGVFDYEALRVFAGPLSGSDEALMRFMRGGV